LALELAGPLVRARGDPAEREFSGIATTMRELSDFNSQILQKIGGFKEATRDALAHCERPVLDRYKPNMEELLDKIYENAADLPISDILQRFNDISDEIEKEIQQLQSELINKTEGMKGYSWVRGNWKRGCHPREMKWRGNWT
jgi:hypothetical protein